MSITLSAATVIPYPHTTELKEKSATLTVLLMHTYGPNNPFEELTHTADWCVETGIKVVEQANAQHNAELIEVGIALQNFVGQLDGAISELLSTFVRNTSKDEALRKLTSLCNEITQYIATHALPFSFNQTSTRSAEESRFFFMDPRVFSGIGKFILTGVASVWCLYVIVQAHEYFTSDNDKRIKDIEQDQKLAFKEIVKIRNEMNPYLPISCQRSTALTEPQIHTSRWNIYKRFRQWRARNKDEKSVATQADGLVKSLGDTEETRLLVREWEKAIKTLGKEFPTTKA